MKLILASVSPRRKEILSRAGFDFEIIPSNFDENISGCVFSLDLAQDCAKNKALDVSRRLGREFCIIGADTVVVLDDIILGKPKGGDEARKMLLNLSDREHFVATSICLVFGDKILKDTEITRVSFRKISQKEISEYIEREQPFDKAGSYGIQDRGFDFASRIEGNLDNVIGFPLLTFEKLLKKLF